MDKWDQWVLELLDSARACPAAGLIRELDWKQKGATATIVLKKYFLRPWLSNDVLVFARLSLIFSKENQVFQQVHRLKDLMKPSICHPVI
jgi:hypothetical protein